jgi:glucosamine--fructose-6-phosphate aminotransferase (isomerizing)
MVSGFLNRYGVDESLVEKHKKMQECFVLARGMNYSIALECALKIQETCYVRAKAYSMSDFYHGPLALVEPGMPVFLIATGEKTKEVNTDMVETLNDHGVRPIVITDEPGTFSENGGEITVPQAPGDFTAPFVTAVAVQYFACSLSLAKGLDPDNPRNIKKVTITK